MDGKALVKFGVCGITLAAVTYCLTVCLPKAAPDWAEAGRQLTPEKLTTNLSNLLKTRWLIALGGVVLMLLTVIPWGVALTQWKSGHWAAPPRFGRWLTAAIGEELKAPRLFKDGWLVIVVYFAIFSWSRWISLGGWALFYRRIRIYGNYQAKGITWFQDVMHLGWATGAILVFSYLNSGLPAWVRAVFLSLASFRIVDLLVDFTMLAVFGNRYGRPWQGGMEPRRLHRTLIIDLMLFLELVFWNACWVFVAGTARPDLYLAHVGCPAQALHVSVATVTTIGYGTYAPVQMPSIIAAFVQALSVLLLVTGVISGVFSRNSSMELRNPGAARDKSYYGDEYGLPVIWDQGLGWWPRCVTPLLLPSAIIVAGVWFLLHTGWLA